MKESSRHVMRLGYPGRASACHAEAWGYWPHTADENFEKSEANKAEAINAAIDDLSSAEQMSIYHKHLYAVFRFARLDVDEVYQQARDRLAVVLPRRLIY